MQIFWLLKIEASIPQVFVKSTASEENGGWPCLANVNPLQERVDFTLKT